MGDSLKKIRGRVVREHILKFTESLAGTESLDFGIDFVACIAFSDIFIASPAAAVFIAVIGRIFFGIKKRQSFPCRISARKIYLIAEKARYIHNI